MRKIFVTGVGTDVGKTVISAILAEALHADYWKPVQTGTYYGTDSEKIAKYISNTKTILHPESYCLKHYMSPHAAAEMENVEINLAGINLPQTSNANIIIEGAGGLMVPLNHKRELIIDLIQKLAAEVVVVIQNYMGSINHSLLTLEMLKAKNVKVTGIVFNGPPHQLSHDIIVEYSGTPCIGKVGKENTIDKATVLKYAEQFKNI
jgi:dethiobiotin synthetase